LRTQIEEEQTDCKNGKESEEDIQNNK
jgi:hypothetical protein